MDWILLTIIGLCIFLVWHAMSDTKVDQKIVHVQQPKKGVKSDSAIKTSMTLFAEPGVSGKIIDPLPASFAPPEENVASSSISHPFKTLTEKH